MKITKIKIEGIKGIESREIACVLYPNKPNIFVAPNGFGKTSFATAFNSLKENRLNVDDDNLYRENPDCAPLIELTDDSGETYTATRSSNTINPRFSVAVITSRVTPKASSRNQGRFTSTSTSLAIAPITLYSNIPSKAEFSYSFPNMKASLGVTCGKLCTSLTDNLKNPNFVIKFINQSRLFDKLLQRRNSSKITTCIDNINTISGTKQELLTRIDVSAIEAIDAIGNIDEALGFFFNGVNPKEKIINYIQLLKVYENNKAKKSKILQYNRYLADKKEITEMIGFFNCTWKDIKASKQGSKFVINFPKATQISNGERHILCFIGRLFESRSKLLRKDKSILIIDEIFDYLDDANLIAAQYFLTKFIRHCKGIGKELFPIILTHLDPSFFHTFNFSNKNVVYLDQVVHNLNRYKVNEILKNRKDCKKNNQPVYNCISSNFLHYSNRDTNQSTYLGTLGVPEKLHTANGFRGAAIAELQAYQSDNNQYDLALVCCGLRLTIEKNAFEQLDVGDQEEFLAINKTVDKLAYAKEKGAEIPEVYFLLSIIYNEAMHLDQECKKLHPIGYKLKNKVIKHMIKQIAIISE